LFISVVIVVVSTFPILIRFFFNFISERKNNNFNKRMLPSLFVGRSIARTSFSARPSASLLLAQQAQRLVHIHEYQCHKLMRDAGVSVPNGGVAETPDEAEAVARSLRKSLSFSICLRRVDHLLIYLCGGENLKN